MRISDWSSDVCSSDLSQTRRPHTLSWRRHPDRRTAFCKRHIAGCCADCHAGIPGLRRNKRLSSAQGWHTYHGRRAGQPRPATRSEEHTSELQSLMRISYAVFCLKTKKHSEQNKEYTKTISTHKQSKQQT